MNARGLGWALAAASGLAMLPAQQTVTDAKDKRPSDFDRFVSVGDGGHFDTAITTYRNADGAEVELFAAVHIADAACYRELQRRFAACESLLYEVIGPAEYRPKKGERAASLPELWQQGMANALDLELQLDAI